MEHRWGQRVAIKMPVGFNGCPQAMSWIRDVSASGAFIETTSLASLFSLVHVTFMVGGSMQSVFAYVARVCGDGVGVEWCAFAPQPIRVLLTSAKGVDRRTCVNEVKAIERPQSGKR